MGAAIDAVSEVGDDELAFRDIVFTHSDTERHLEAPLRWTSCIAQRGSWPKPRTGKLGPLLEISDDPAAPDYGPYRSPSAGAAMLRAEAVDTPISIGSDLITVTVRGVFALR